MKRSILALVFLPGLAWAQDSAPVRLVETTGTGIIGEFQAPQVQVVAVKQDVAAPALSVPELPRLAEKIVESVERAPFEEP